MRPFVRILAMGVLFTLGLLPLQSWAADDRNVTLYKNPGCGCCEGYADYLRKNGFVVKVVETEELPQMNQKYGVSETQAGCHISLIGGYAVEGHVSIDLVNRLLAEKPRVAGIILPGMSMGTPGMGGTTKDVLTVYAIAPGSPVYGVQ